MGAVRCGGVGLVQVYVVAVGRPTRVATDDNSGARLCSGTQNISAERRVLDPKHSTRRDGAQDAGTAMSELIDELPIELMRAAC